MGSIEHTEALLEHLRGDPELASIVFDGYVPGTAPTRYVIVFASSPEHEVDRFAGRQRPRTFRHTIHCIGQIPAEAQWLTDRVQARLVGARLDVEGWDCKPIKHAGGLPVRLDSSTPPAVFFFADDYAWEAQP